MTVEYTDPGENFTVEHGKAILYFVKPKQDWEEYQDNAKEILEQLSNTYNRIGISTLIGALIERFEEAS